MIWMNAMEWFRLCRMVEGDEQYGVEEVLRHLQAPLQVVYTMSLSEVKENVSAWKGAIRKEVEALISCGALVRMDPVEEDKLRRDNRLVVLPAKGVFTVKPPDSVEGASGGQVIEPEDQAALIKGVPDTKSTDQAVSTEGVHTKSADQAVSTEGVHWESTQSPQTRPCPPRESTQSPQTRPCPPRESTQSPQTRPCPPRESTQSPQTRSCPGM